MKNRAILAFACVFLIYVLYSASWVSTGILGPKFKALFDLNNSQVALLTNIVTLSKLLGTLCGAYVFSRFGLKKVYIAGVLMLGTSCLTSSYEEMLLGRVLMGFGSAFAVVMLIPIAIQLFKEKLIAIGVNECANSAGNMLIIFAAPLLLGFFNLHEIFYFFTGLIYLLLLVFYFVYSDSMGVVSAASEPSSTLSSTPSPKPSLAPSSYFAPLKKPLLWRLVFTYFGPLCFLNAAFVIAPNYIAKTGLPPTLLGYISLAAIFGSFFGALFFKKEKAKIIILISTAFMLFAVLLLVFALLYSLANVYLLLLCLSLGLCYGLVLPFMFIQSADISPIENAKLLSFFWALTYLFLAGNSQVMAALSDHFGYGASSIYLLFALFLSLLNAIFALRKRV